MFLLLFLELSDETSLTKETDLPLETLELHFKTERKPLAPLLTRPGDLTPFRRSTGSTEKRNLAARLDFSSLAPEPVGAWPYRAVLFVLVSTSFCSEL